MMPATLSDTTLLDLDPPLTLNRRAASATVLGRFRMTVEVVRTMDVDGIRYLVETRNSCGALTSSVRCENERAALMRAYRMGI